VKRALLLAVSVTLFARAEAQSGASVTADAVVVTVGMTIATLRDLDFGTVIKGVPATVLPTAPVGGTIFNPATGIVGRFGPTANPTMYVWLGGTVSPAVTAKPGIHQGTVVVSLLYQ
jgi:hypothetical protein